MSYSTVMESTHDFSRATIVIEEARVNADSTSGSVVGESANGKALGKGRCRRIKSERPGYTICRKCLTDKPNNEYYARHGTCKSCCYLKNKANKGKYDLYSYHRKYAEQNKDKIKLHKTKWRNNNKAAAAESARRRYAANPEKRFIKNKKQRERYRQNLEAMRKRGRAASAKYLNKNKEKVNAKLRARAKTALHKEKVRLRRKADVAYRLRCVLRKRINGICFNNKSLRAGSAVRDLGCSIAALKAHLEAQFKPGMTWENHAIDGWHIDHIVPLASFDLTNREQFLKAAHYTNLQPLWAKENLSKGDRLLDLLEE